MVKERERDLWITSETVTEYEARMKRIAEVFNTVEPDHLLEEDRYLVLDHSPEEY